MFKKLFSNEKAVSPVIGVMLMIVVTVILAAAVSSFAGSVDTKDAAPQATYKVSADESDNVTTIECLGGDTVYKNNVKIEIASGFPVSSGYVDSNDIVFEPHEDYLAPGDIATITVGDTTDPEDTTYPYEHLPGYGMWFNGTDISQAVYIGDSFKLTLIDTQTGQTIYSTNVIVNP